uniref:Uncharacterized protein n=1 Tax=Fusarium oxysporum (strain Fo5176) TaxID=660025 RepID=A0A0D2Y888_FUSOF
MAEEEYLTVTAQISFISAAAYIGADGKPVVLDFGCDRKTVPSTIAIEEGQWLVAPMDITAPSEGGHLIRRSKRFMGRRNPQDGKLKRHIEESDTEFQINEEGIPVHKIGEEEVRPEEAYALLVDHLKTRAEETTGKQVGRCVVAIPANFTDLSRQAVLDSCKIIGLSYAKVINEPTAAMIGFSRRYPDTKGNYFLVVDVGDGTTDCALVYANNERTSFDVQAISGDNYTGGGDLTTALEDWFDAKVDHGLSPHERRLACEAAKHTTSGTMRIRYGSQVSKIETDVFKDLKGVQDFFGRLNKVVDQAAPDMRRVDGVIVVGCTLYHPVLQDWCTRKFGSKRLPLIDLASLVSQGAAYAALCDEITVAEVLGQRISIGTEDDTIEVLAAQSEKIPCTKVKKLWARHDDETELHICQGQSEKFSENISLYSFYHKMKKDTPFILKVVIKADGTLDISVEIEGAEPHKRTVERKAGLSDETIKTLRDRNEGRLGRKFTAVSDTATTKDAVHTLPSKKRKRKTEEENEEEREGGKAKPKRKPKTTSTSTRKQKQKQKQKQKEKEKEKEKEKAV